jgi:hypothetical protein
LVYEKNANFFAENCRKSPKVAIITSTPAFCTTATAGIRIVLFPVVVKAQKNMVALNNVLPEFQRRQQKMMDSKLPLDERKRSPSRWMRAG